ncbi:Inositol-tetrakisphosphate 1-kinase [Zostera marina]|uniref:Inositol-tetrakisphosphate 1-kinase n=1 Tax=Zostera marina TaxID=29655 RepID=A0A0K9NKW8_ZOSMR|nr:Inositol-tetrakisphosphate 1-kinase [Zostera marina]
MFWFRYWIERFRSLHFGGEVAEMGKNRKIGIFDEEIELKKAEEKENKTGRGISPHVDHIEPILIVGYALTTKKVKSFLQPKFEMLARKKGILFVKIDANMCLSEQGPFDIILHKLLRKKWFQDLEDYREQHPNVVVLDSSEGIQRVHNRLSMLKDVSDLNFSDSCGKIDVPRQLVINKDPSTIADVVTKAGLKLPLVAKPLMVDGSAKSHALSLVYNQSSLSKLDPPLILQEFINHGGILFKTYIVGDIIRVVRRFSLPDIEEHDILNHSGVFNFPRVSCAAASADDTDLSPSIAEFPPSPLLERFARELRHRLGLQIFNMDIIRERGTTDRYYVIDINYFPGLGKLPGYEQLFTDFLLGFTKENKANN